MESLPSANIDPPKHTSTPKSWSRCGELRTSMGQYTLSASSTSAVYPPSTNDFALSFDLDVHLFDEEAGPCEIQKPGYTDRPAAQSMSDPHQPFNFSGSIGGYRGKTAEVLLSQHESSAPILFPVTGRRPSTTPHHADFSRRSTPHSLREPNDISKQHFAHRTLLETRQVECSHQSAGCPASSIGRA